MDGTLESADGRWRIRFTRHLAHPRDKVWRAITEPEHLRAWFPQYITGEWRPGATLTFSGDGPDFGGEVLSWEPPRLLEFTWGNDSLRLELAERDGGCTLTLLDTLDEVGTAARTAAGWHECLDRLGYALDESAYPGQPGDVWARVHPRYVAAFGPEGSAIGPPAGHEPGRRPA